MRKSGGAFTFVELLVTLAIFSVILGLLLETLVGSFRSFDSRSERLETLTQCNIFTAWMRRDLRTAVLAPDTPIQFLAAGVVFHRVAGVKTGSDGNIGMPEIHLVSYAWDPEAGGVVRRAATADSVQDRLFLRGMVREGGFSLRPASAPATGTVTSLPDGPLCLRFALSCSNGVALRSTLMIHSRFIPSPGRDDYAQGWYDNWRIHPATSNLFPLLSDYRSVPTAISLSDKDTALDSGMKMGGGAALGGDQ